MTHLGPWSLGDEDLGSSPGILACQEGLGDVMRFSHPSKENLSAVEAVRGSDFSLPHQ